MLPFLQDQYGNASSQYSLGVNAKHAIEVASAIGISYGKYNSHDEVDKIVIAIADAYNKIVASQ